jgi:hypothetical protein
VTMADSLSEYTVGHCAPYGAHFVHTTWRDDTDGSDFWIYVCMKCARDNGHCPI